MRVCMRVVSLSVYACVSVCVVCMREFIPVCVQMWGLAGPLM
jgi:hypothetical protein